MFNLANKLTLFRMMVVPFFILCIYHQYYRIATILFLVAGITDALEGFKEVDISLTVPAMFKDDVVDWLANGEARTGPGLGKGVMRRCGLL